MRSLAMGFCALISTGAAHAQEASEPYATVGLWELAVEPDGTQCKMYRFYGSRKGDGIEGLVVRYDAGNQVVMLTWVTQNLSFLPVSGELELFLNFVKGKTFNDSWGGREFHYHKPDDTYYFTHRFTDAKDVQRFLRDFGASEIIGLDLGPVMETALFLDADEATNALRQCSLKLSAGGFAGLSAQANPQ